MNADGDDDHDPAIPSAKRRRSSPFARCSSSSVPNMAMEYRDDPTAPSARVAFDESGALVEHYAGTRFDLIAGADALAHKIGETRPKARSDTSAADHPHLGAPRGNFTRTSATARSRSTTVSSRELQKLS